MGGRGAKSGVRDKGKSTDSEILSRNIEVVKKIAEKGFMPEEALNYGGSSEIRTAFYEALDKIYSKNPSGYIYSLHEADRKRVYGYAQFSRTYSTEEWDRHHTKRVKKRHTSMLYDPKGKVEFPGDLVSREAKRGYAKAYLYRIAGKIYDPKTKRASEKYPVVER